MEDIIKAVYIEGTNEIYTEKNVSMVFNKALSRYGLCYTFNRPFTVTKSGLSNAVWLMLDIQAEEFLVGSVGSKFSPGALVSLVMSVHRYI